MKVAPKILSDEVKLLWKKIAHTVQHSVLVIVKRDHMYLQDCCIDHMDYPSPCTVQHALKYTYVITPDVD